MKLNENHLAYLRFNLDIFPHFLDTPFIILIIGWIYQRLMSGQFVVDQ